MSLSDEDVARIARAVADEIDERKEARRVEQVPRVSCPGCEAGWPLVQHGSMHAVPGAPGYTSCANALEDLP